MKRGLSQETMVVVCPHLYRKLDGIIQFPYYRGGLAGMEIITRERKKEKERECKVLPRRKLPSPPT